VSEGGRARENGYRAFISYSHRDDAAAKSLHKRLETYRLPKKLIGQVGERGPIPQRLTPIFRDLDELSAADDLTVEIKAALARSATLIVLCSPGAKASKWVNLEIETFRALHGNSRPVLAALIEGEPADAFPPALTADGHEPVAADFRKGRDGKRLALLKLVAGMAGAPLDALVQRDAQRQLRRVTAITVSALTAVVAMALLLVVALRAQSEAERQRQEAEGLVEYMITDLRDKLKGVGRLNVMTAVNERAMKYYGAQEALNDLPVESLERRARVLHAMGEDDQARGELSLALNKFEEAHRVTEALLFKNPNDSERIFAHSQSKYWIGYQLFQQKQIVKSRKYFFEYAGLAKQLVKIDSKNPRWIKELGYAEGNICASALSEPIDKTESHRACNSAISYLEKTAFNKKNNLQDKYDLADAYAWLADSHAASGDFLNSLNLRKKQLKILEGAIDIDKNNASLIQNIMLAEIGISEVYLSLKNYNLAKIYADRSKKKIIKLILIDPKNKNWINWRSRIQSIYSKI
jgi:tetratricopeptide (TPR) repeat protein